MAALTVYITGGRSVQIALDGAARQVQNWRPVLEQIRTDFREHEKQVFATEGGAAGVSWPPLSESVTEWKAKHYPGNGMLRRTDALMRSLTQPNAKGSIGRISGDTLEAGSGLTTPDGRWSLADIHHHGRKDGSIPARPLLEIPDNLIVRWTGFVREHVAQAVEQAAATGEAG